MQYGYSNDPRWKDPNLGWYGTPQHQYQEPPLQNTCMPPPVQELQQLQSYEPAQATPHPSTTSEPTLKELLYQMTMQNIQFQQENMKFQQENMECSDS
ncbi:hypothetical protein LR48_Vigan632s000900 [Vigna angularis]|uniref:Uncharacterized protein n=1 Tax=Phaseolus angularis TaxID=3914 RepID=A0A0L9TG41_PHAAN|nr:hypothetical protein LR48_Vigan632s000900 [Vigna angularis]